MCNSPHTHCQLGLVPLVRSSAQQKQSVPFTKTSPHTRPSVSPPCDATRAAGHLLIQVTRLKRKSFTTRALNSRGCSLQGHAGQSPPRMGLRAGTNAASAAQGIAPPGVPLQETSRCWDRAGRALKPFCFHPPCDPVRKNGQIVFQTEPMWSLNVPCHLGYKSSCM